MYALDIRPALLYNSLISDDGNQYPAMSAYRELSVGVRKRRRGGEYIPELSREPK
jgi:hypothetical protein